MSEMSYDDARDALANLDNELVLKARDLMLNMHEPAEGDRLERELEQFNMDDARAMMGQLDDSQLRVARDLVSAMEEQVWEEECINGSTGIGGGAYQWNKRYGRRGVSMEAQVLEEGCINGIRGTGGGVYQWKHRYWRRGVSMQ